MDNSKSAQDTEELEKDTGGATAKPSDGSFATPPELNPELNAGINTETLLEKAKPERDATRYGDWEMNGRCIDF